MDSFGAAEANLTRVKMTSLTTGPKFGGVNDERIKRHINTFRTYFVFGHKEPSAFFFNKKFATIEIFYTFATHFVPIG